MKRGDRMDREFAGLVRIEAGSRQVRVFAPASAGEVFAAVRREVECVKDAALGCWVVTQGIDVLRERLELAGYRVRTIWPKGQRPPVRLKTRTIAGPVWHLTELTTARGQ